MEECWNEACPDCRDELAHCHDALLIDADGFTECSNPTCSELAEVHGFVEWVVEVALDLTKARSPVVAA